jgi:hypothetical protein
MFQVHQTLCSKFDQIQQLYKQTAKLDEHTAIIGENPTTPPWHSLRKLAALRNPAGLPFPRRCTEAQLKISRVLRPWIPLNFLLK